MTPVPAKKPACVEVICKPLRRIAGFHHETARHKFMQAVRLGSMPVATEYTLMEHKVTGARAIYMENTLSL